MKINDNKNFLPVLLSSIFIIFIVAFSNQSSAFNRDFKTIENQRETGIFNTTENAPHNHADALTSGDFHFRTSTIASSAFTYIALPKPATKKHLVFNPQVVDKPSYYSFLFRYTLF